MRAEPDALVTTTNDQKLLIEFSARQNATYLGFLAKADEIRLDTKMVMSPEFTGKTDSRLNFVHD